MGRSNTMAVEMTGDEARLWQSLQKILVQQPKIENGFRKIGRAGKAARRAVEGLADRAVGLASIATAVGLITTAFQDLETARKAATTGIVEGEDNLKRLVQIAGGRKSTLRGYHSLANELAGTWGIDLNTAHGMVFEGTSLGLSEADIRRSGAYKRFSRDVIPLIKGAGGMAQAFGEQAAGGTTESRVNAMLSAATTSRLDIEGIAANVMDPARSVKDLGGTAEETLAALAVAAGATKSGETGGVVVGRLADVLRKNRRFKGRTLTESLHMLHDMPFAQQERIIGENLRAHKGAGILIENIEKYDAALANVTRAVQLSGTAHSPVEEAIALAGQDEHLSALEAVGRARARKTIAGEGKWGSKELIREAIDDHIDTYLAESDAGLARRAFSRVGGWLARWEGDEGAEYARARLQMSIGGLPTSQAYWDERDRILQEWRDSGVPVPDNVPQRNRDTAILERIAVGVERAIEQRDEAATAAISGEPLH